MAESKIILLVEDNPDDVSLTIRSLNKNRFTHELLVARTGEEAVTILENERNLPSLILLDLKLPGISGLEVLEWVRNNRRTSFIPVVILTTSREDRDIQTSYSLGANSYIQKPIDFNQFTEVVGHLGLYWLMLNEIPSLR